MERKIKTFALIGAGGGGGTSFKYSGIQIGTGEQMNVWTGTLDEFNQLTPDEHTVYFIDGGSYQPKKNYFYLENNSDAPVDAYIQRSGTPALITPEFSTDKENWVDYGNTNTRINFTVPAKSKLYIRCKCRGWSDKYGHFNRFYFTEKMNVGGNILSLLYGDEYVDGVKDLPQGTSMYCFQNLLSSTAVEDASNLVLDINNMTDYCFFDAFGKCASLVNAPALPAKSLSKYCYSNMFYDCTSLATSPELPATTVPESAYSSMFAGCTSLQNVGKISATSVEYEGCYSMFAACTSLTTAPTLLATTLGNGAYSTMFYNCTRLVNAPVLPARTVGPNAYSSMFTYCTSLVNAPALPATKLGVNSYNSMFLGCTSLVNAPELSATTVPENAYGSMFAGCTALKNVGKISATSVEYEGCYSMFAACTSLTTAPILSATTLGDGAYTLMFYRCTSLVNAPELPATTIGINSYMGMFMDCTSLVKAAPILPAVNVPQLAYSYMYGGCSALTDAGEMSGVSYDVEACSSMFYKCTSLSNPLIITPTFGGITVGNKAFLSMFKMCTSLERVPNIAYNKIESNGLAYMYQECTSLVSSGLIQCADAASDAYNNLFNDCANMRYIIATDSSYNAEAYVEWTMGLPDSGVFIKSPTATWPRGVNGIPEGWVIVDEGAERGDIMYYKSTDGLKVEPNETKFVDENGDQAIILANDYQDNLGVITFDRNVARITGGAFSAKIKLKEVWLPFYLTDTGNGTFDDCANLELIHMWYHVNNIGATFNRIPNLREVFVGSGDPPTLSSNQANNLKTYGCPVYVPAGSVNDYRQATNWNIIADQIKPM